jgi:hypothetical protein
MTAYAWCRHRSPSRSKRRQRLPGLFLLSQHFFASHRQNSKFHRPACAKETRYGFTAEEIEISKSIVDSLPSKITPFLFHRVRAAFLAIDTRTSEDSFSARERPPISPPMCPRVIAAALFPCSAGVGSLSSTWPLAISTTSLAAWLKSRGRFGCLSAIIGIITTIANKARAIHGRLIQTDPLPAVLLP